MDAKLRDILGRILAGLADAYGLPIVVEIVGEVAAGKHR